MTRYKLIWAVVAPMLLGLSACGGGGDEGGASPSATQGLPPSAAAPAATPVAAAARATAFTLGQWHMGCRNGFEYPAMLPQYPAWLRVYGYRVTLSIDRMLNSDEAEATVTYSSVDGSHCDATPATVLGEVIRTYRLRRVGQTQIEGRVADQVEATLLNERRTGGANPAPGDTCVTTHELPHRVPVCELPNLPVLKRTVLALDGNDLLTGFHARGIQPPGSPAAPDEDAAGFETAFDPLAVYHRVAN